MTDTLPLVFMALCGASLVTAVFLFSRSFAAVFGDASVDDTVPHVLPEDQQTLLDEKRALLVALRDLEAERQHGKVSEEDYKRLEAQYRGRARRVLQQLDGSVAPYREDAERLVAAHLRKRGVTPTGPSEDAPSGVTADTESSATAETPASPEPATTASSEPETTASSEPETTASPEPEATASPEPEARPSSTPAVRPEPDERSKTVGEGRGVGAESSKATSAKSAARACESCSTVNDEDAAFCKKCGTRLEAANA
ncbi:MAG: hypothetical protein IT379_05390 [Deltaproteobacteria bacterium]|nr:hypothetical protein [Deltaproteobacteria bacterium]